MTQSFSGHESFVNRKGFFPLSLLSKGKRKGFKKEKEGGTAFLAGRVSEEGISKFICFWLFLKFSKSGKFGELGGDDALKQGFRF